MSFYDYLVAREILLKDPPFYSLIQAAMRKADSNNLELLRRCWPFTWDELQLRYNAPGGKIEGDPL